MAHLPVITGFGGISPAGRSSGHQAYRRMVIDVLDAGLARDTRASLAALSGRLRREGGRWLDQNGNQVERDAYLATIAAELDRHTLIRRLEKNLFDPDRLYFHKRARLNGKHAGALEFDMHRKQLPSPVPADWIISEASADPRHLVHVEVPEPMEVMLPCQRSAAVTSAGQLPSGFEPGRLYPSRNHPRALQMTIYAASDAIHSLGIDWETVRQRVAPDQISVYAGSAMGQLDYNGFGGMLQARLLGKKVSSKHMPLGYAEMPADFINAYLLGNLGSTGSNVAACATFLYNLRQGMRDIQSGSHRVVLVGASEAPLFPEAFDGFATMGALADDAALQALDGLSPEQDPDHRRACRPFGANCGFTLGESAQYVVLFDDSLALELGANIYGAVNDVFVNADGHKKSITSPGLGNYISMAKAASATRQVIGEQGLRRRSLVQAHGTGTPQNRVTESHILDQVAANFGIQDWPVSAVKTYVGHSIATSAGDQLAATLGLFHHGIVPGIHTVDAIADDVSHEHLDFLLAHRQLDPAALEAVLINSKGFGGNNASASILAPQVVDRMLAKRHGEAALSAWRQRNETVQQATADYDQRANEGKNETIYRFDHNVLGGDAISMDNASIQISDIEPAISLSTGDHYQDMR